MVFGLCAGVVAQLLMPGKGERDEKLGCIGSMAIGIVGAVIGGFIGTALDLGDVDGFNLGSFLLAVLGTIVLLALVRLLRR